jgi:SWI/SNF-related matrix-associated actin-dependent regulator 1 of chromatin subfamily A
VILDYVPQTDAFTLILPRSEGPLIRKLMEEHGLDFSKSGSTSAEALLFTHEPYAAVAFWDHATPAAHMQLRSLRNQIDTSWAKDTGFRFKCPSGEEAWPFQNAGVEYALNRRNTLFGDVPGLGKTVQFIGYCNEIEAKRVLVVCPASIRLQWARMIRRWSTMPWPYNVYTILKGRDGVHPHAAWTVISYELARQAGIGEALSKLRWDVIGLDEAHYVKTVDAARTRAIFGGGEERHFAALASRAEAVHCLTGTPLPNRPREAYVLADGICPDAIGFMSEDAFRQRFNPAIRLYDDRHDRWYIDERTGRHSELQARLRANFMVRREKAAVMTQLKIPEYDLIRLEEDGPIRAALKAERLLGIDPDHLPGPTDPIFGEISTIRKQMGVAMAPHAADYVEMLLLGGEEKIVVYGWHIEVLNIIQAKLRRYGVVRIDGSTSPTQKESRVNAFRTDPAVRVIMGNLMSLGTGTDGLQDVCGRAVLAEPDWVPGNNIQCVDRLDRGGQTRTVLADFLVVPGSLSEKILGKAITKLDTVDKVLDRRHF